MKITYGIIDNNIDVTDICKRLAKQNIIKIPSGDNNRAARFTDPLCGILKSVFIISDDGTVVEYDATKIIYIDLMEELFVLA